jgi:hypothetical protein
MVFLHVRFNLNVSNSISVSNFLYVRFSSVYSLNPLPPRKALSRDFTAQYIKQRISNGEVTSTCPQEQGAECAM